MVTNDLIHTKKPDDVKSKLGSLALLIVKTGLSSF